MKVQTPTEFIASMLTPQRRSEAYAWINDYIAKLAKKQERQRRQAVAQNELESTGENHD